MISFNPNDRPSIEFIVFWIDEILNELEDIENNYNLNISAPSLKNQAISDEAYSKVPPAAKNTNPRTTENTRPHNPNGRLNPV
ncbi:hypothetical protein [Rothia sp. 88186D007BW]